MSIERTPDDVRQTTEFLRRTEMRTRNCIGCGRSFQPTPQNMSVCLRCMRGMKKKDGRP